MDPKRRNFRILIRTLVSTFLLLGLITSVPAQEFWMQPEKFTHIQGDNLEVNFRSGDNLMGEPWDIESRQIESLEMRQLSSTRDLPGFVKNTGEGALEIPLTREGTHLLLMRCKNELTEWKAAEFNVRLKENGLDEIYDFRRQANALATASKESQSRYTKLIIQVGNQTDNTFKQDTGYPLEIIPERNPYSLKKGDPIRFTILFEGKPLFGIKVKILNRYDHRTTIQNIYTEKNGMMETHISNPGTWMVSVVKMVPSGKEGAEWQSFQHTLVFGVE